MPATDHQPSFLGRISIRRNQIASMDGNHEQELEDLEFFQKHVADRFAELLSPSSSAALSIDENSSVTFPADSLLSINWLRKLLDVFLCCEAEFKAILIMGRDPTQISKPPLDRLIPELLERAVKVLDICTAVVNGIESVRHCQHLGEITVAALEQKPLGDGNVRRAKRALHNMIAALSLEDKESGGGYKSTERSWSFGRRGGGGGNKIAYPGNYRALTLSIGKNWSAAKQVQAMATNLAAPRGAELTGLPLPIYIMSMVSVFTMWSLVAAVPCQERNGLVNHIPVPKQLPWAQSVIVLQEKIGEELKKKDKKGCGGLLEEMQRMEKLGQNLIEFTDNFQFPVDEEKAEEVAEMVADLAEVCRRMEEGLVPLQMQIREVFHRVVRSRTEILDALDQATRVSSPAV